VPNFRNIFLLLLLVVVFLAISGVISITGIFDLVLLEPMLNFLVLLSKYLFGSFGLAILVLTVIVRLITYPTYTRQMKSQRSMQELQPKIKELQKKYAKDKERLSQETMKLYKEHGVNPLGCAFHMLVQFPIWIALYQSVIQGLGFAPENLVGLSKQLYHFSAIQGQVPLNEHFLWLDLGSGDIFMAIIVAVSMWVLQKMSASPAADPSQQSMSRIMLWVMPLMFGFFALTFPSGLSLYWALTNILSIGMQYRMSGWGSLGRPSLASIRGMFGPGGLRGATVVSSGPGGKSKGAGGARALQPGGAAAEDGAGTEGEGTAEEAETSRRKRARHGKHRDRRKVRRRSS
jgi:YidC/Oxa1 family membrane protein insertase